MATPLDTSVLVGRCAERFRELGLTVRQSSDFSRIDAIIDEIGKPYLTPQLSPNWHEFTEETAFWLIAEDLEGAPVGMMGVRLDELPVDFFDKRNAMVEAVTLEDVNRVAAEYLNPENFTFVVVGEPQGLDG